MFLSILNAAALLLLGVTAVQDLRSRAVSIILFPLLLLCFTGIALQATSLEELFSWTALNILFLALQLGLVYVYFWVKNRRRTAVIGQSIGLGDLLFWLVACVLFSPANFIFFFLSSLVFSLVLHLSLSVFASTYNKATIPLAGFQAMYMALALGGQWLVPALDFQDDYLVLGYLM